MTGRLAVARRLAARGPLERAPARTSGRKGFTLLERGGIQKGGSEHNITLVCLLLLCVSLLILIIVIITMMIIVFIITSTFTPLSSHSKVTLFPDPPFRNPPLGDGERTPLGFEQVLSGVLQDSHQYPGIII